MIEGIIYVARRGHRIKFGYSGYNLRRRLRKQGLRSGDIMGMVRGTLQNEHSLHRILRRHDTEGRSWYPANKQTLALVAEILSPGFAWSRLRTVDDRYYDVAGLKPKWKKVMASEAPDTLSKVCRDNLLTLARVYGRAKGVSLSSVSKEFYGNVNFLKKFAAGKHSVSLSKMDEMLERFRDQWPEGVSWPYLSAIVFARPKKRG